jgi:hypothetical protein
VLGPKYDPILTAARLQSSGESMICDASATVNSKTNQWHIMQAVVGKVYLLLGRDLEGSLYQMFATIFRDRQNAFQIQGLPDCMISNPKSQFG